MKRLLVTKPFCTLNFAMLLCAASLVVFAACSDSPSGANTAGTIIETNTGNKGLARMYISTAALSAAAFDTLVASYTESDTVGDTIYVSRYGFEKVLDSVEVLTGIAEIVDVPVGTYDSVEIRSASGEVRSVSVEWVAVEGEVSYDAALPMKEPQAVSLDVGTAVDGASAAELADMPFPVWLPASLKNPCLTDAAGSILLLDSAGAAGDSVLYWGLMETVALTKNGSIEFKAFDNCALTNHTGLPLARAYWLPEVVMDTTGDGQIIGMEKTFTDSLTLGVSFWIHMDAAEQLQNYARILVSDKDSAGFIVQQREATNKINIRINTRDGDYNAVFGTAEILDGAWHQYAFTIAKNEVTIYVDGEFLERRTFEGSEGLDEASYPLIGGYNNMVGGIQNVFFTDGAQGEDWFKLFYALQKNVVF